VGAGASIGYRTKIELRGRDAPKKCQPQADSEKDERRIIVDLIREAGAKGVEQWRGEWVAWRPGENEATPPEKDEKKEDWKKMGMSQEHPGVNTGC